MKKKLDLSPQDLETIYQFAKNAKKNTAITVTGNSITSNSNPLESGGEFLSVLNGNGVNWTQFTDKEFENLKDFLDELIPEHTNEILDTLGVYINTHHRDEQNIGLHVETQNREEQITINNSLANAEELKVDSARDHDDIESKSLELETSTTTTRNLEDLEIDRIKKLHQLLSNLDSGSDININDLNMALTKLSSESAKKINKITKKFLSKYDRKNKPVESEEELQSMLGKILKPEYLAEYNAINRNIAFLKTQQRLQTQLDKRSSIKDLEQKNILMQNSEAFAPAMQSATKDYVFETTRNKLENLIRGINAKNLEKTEELKVDSAPDHDNIEAKSLELKTSTTRSLEDFEIDRVRKLHQILSNADSGLKIDRSDLKRNLQNLAKNKFLRRKRQPQFSEIVSNFLNKYDRKNKPVESEEELQSMLGKILKPEYLAEYNAINRNIAFLKTQQRLQTQLDKRSSIKDLEQKNILMQNSEVFAPAIQSATKEYAFEATRNKLENLIRGIKAKNSETTAEQTHKEIEKAVEDNITFLLEELRKIESIDTALDLEKAEGIKNKLAECIFQDMLYHKQNQLEENHSRLFKMIDERPKRPGYDVLIRRVISEVTNKVNLYNAQQKEKRAEKSAAISENQENEELKSATPEKKESPPITKVELSEEINRQEIINTLNLFLQSKLDVRESKVQELEPDVQFPSLEETNNNLSLAQKNSDRNALIKHYLREIKSTYHFHKTNNIELDNVLLTRQLSFLQENMERKDISETLKHNNLEEALMLILYDKPDYLETIGLDLERLQSYSAEVNQPVELNDRSHLEEKIQFTELQDNDRVINRNDEPADFARVSSEQDRPHFYPPEQKINDNNVNSNLQVVFEDSGYKPISIIPMGSQFRSDFEVQNYKQEHKFHNIRDMEASILEIDDDDGQTYSLVQRDISLTPSNERGSIQKYRTIEFINESGTTIDAPDKTLELSIALKDIEGENMEKKEALYFYAKYDQGKLTDLDIISENNNVEKPVRIFLDGKNDQSAVFLKIDGKKYTLPISKKQLELMQERVPNFREKFRLSVNAKDQVRMREKLDSSRNEHFSTPSNAGSKPRQR